MTRLCLLLLLAGCASQPAAAPVCPTAVQSEPRQVAAEFDLDTLFLAVEGDLDGDRQAETIALFDDGTLVAGALRGEAEITSESLYWRGQQAKLELVRLAPGDFAVLVTQPVSEDEDPPNVYQLFVARDGALVRVFKRTVGAYGVQPLVFEGDGTLRYVEDGWGACTRLEHPAEAVRQEVVFAPDASGNFVERERIDTDQVQRCNELAACPWVVRVDARGAHEMGEILRDLRGPERRGPQTLDLGPVEAGPLRVELHEREDEVTYLGSLHLEVDGRRVAPRAAVEDVMLLRGDVLAVEFELPAAGHAVLHATGHYVPTTRPELTRAHLRPTR